MGRRWRLVLGTPCVEAVVLATVPVYGPLALLAVAVV
jgi:hypothetical protein